MWCVRVSRLVAGWGGVADARRARSSSLVPAAHSAPRQNRVVMDITSKVRPPLLSSLSSLCLPSPPSLNSRPGPSNGSEDTSDVSCTPRGFLAIPERGVGTSRQDQTPLPPRSLTFGFRSSGDCSRTAQHGLQPIPFAGQRSRVTESAQQLARPRLIRAPSSAAAAGTAAARAELLYARPDEHRQPPT